MALTETPLDVIVRSPWGRYVTTGSSIVWCASRGLSGAYVWGCPDGDETRAIVRLFDEYPRVMDPTFDMILDTRAVVTVDREALEVLTKWMWTHRSALLERARVTSVIRQEPTGYLLAGLLPTIANNRSFRVTTEPATAFRAVLGEGGIGLAEDIEAIALRLRGVPRELQAIRALLSTRLDATVEDAAQEAGTSARSLQRILSRSGTSFHDELVAARFAAAGDLLLTTDLKVAAAVVGGDGAALVVMTSSIPNAAIKSDARRDPRAPRAPSPSGEQSLRRRASYVELLRDGSRAAPSPPTPRGRSRRRCLA